MVLVLFLNAVFSLKVPLANRALQPEGQEEAKSEGEKPCAEEKGGCRACAGAPTWTGIRCGWCPDGNTCVLASAGCENMIQILRDCPQPDEPFELELEGYLKSLGVPMPKGPPCDKMPLSDFKALSEAAMREQCNLSDEDLASVQAAAQKEDSGIRAWLKSIDVEPAESVWLALGQNQVDLPKLKAALQPELAEWEFTTEEIAKILRQATTQGLTGLLAFLAKIGVFPLTVLKQKLEAERISLPAFCSLDQGALMVLGFESQDVQTILRAPCPGLGDDSGNRPGPGDDSGTGNGGGGQLERGLSGGAGRGEGEETRQNHHHLQPIEKKLKYDCIGGGCFGAHKPAAADYQCMLAVPQWPENHGGYQSPSQFATGVAKPIVSPKPVPGDYVGGGGPDSLGPWQMVRAWQAGCWCRPDLHLTCQEFCVPESEVEVAVQCIDDKCSSGQPSFVTTWMKKNFQASTVGQQIPTRSEFDPLNKRGKQATAECLSACVSRGVCQDFTFSGPGYESRAPTAFSP